MTDYTMNPSLQADVLREIEFNYGGKVKGAYINQIECPTCGKKEAFTSSENPWVIKCGRANNCGEAHHIKELFPQLFESWTDRYQPATEAERIANPTAVADGYLKDGRGFDLSTIKGWYSQEWFQSPEINEGSTTVRFPMPNGFWERVLDKPERFGKLKARAVGDYKGLVWLAPIFTDVDLANAERVVITEGIFDAIAWISAGHIAASNISSSNYPSALLSRIKKACADANTKLPKICWAQDGDKAGQKAIRKFAAMAKRDGWNVCAAQPPAGRRNHDWNDLHQLGLMKKDHIDDYFHFGELLLAKSAAEKALLMYERKERREFWFTFYSSLYWFKLDLEAYDKEVRQMEDKLGDLSEDDRGEALRNAGGVRKISTAIPRPLYFQENRVTQEQWYYFGVETDEGHTKLAFTPKQLTSPGEFKNRLLAVKNAWWVGEAKQLERLLMDMTHNLKTVETIDYIGYSKEHKTYVWNDAAVREGRIQKINNEDYFQFGRLQLKTLAQSPELDINTNSALHDATWPRHLAGAFGSVGIISCAYFFGSLFAEQIRQTQKSYPFFELVGEAGAGKTTLIEFLWKLLGRDEHEGFDPQKSTVAARARLFSQVSNLPVVLIESDREASDSAKAKQFDWDDLKTAFNGRSMRSRGVKNSGNDTYEPPFRGTIVISQNEQVMASDAILSRICHITVTREFQNPDTKQHAEYLERVPVEAVSNFILQATSAEKNLMPMFFSRSTDYENELLNNGKIRMMRIAKNQGQMMALVDCLGPEGLNLFTPDEINNAKNRVREMAVERQQAINSDHPLVQEFWEAVDYIDGYKETYKLNHFGFETDTPQGDPTRWAINLKEFETKCGDFKLRVPDMRLLKNLLKTSKGRKFIEANSTVRSKLDADRVLKCWIFEAPKIKTTGK